MTKDQEAKVMKQETSVVARNYRLQEWAFMVQECNKRPREMTITQWCSEHDIKPANYYYRLNEVRKACHNIYIHFTEQGHEDFICYQLNTFIYRLQAFKKTIILPM